MSVRIERGPRLKKMGREALGPRISKWHKENASYFDKDSKGAQIVQNAPGGPRISKCHKENVHCFRKDSERP